ncbi:MAG: response regulator [Parafilimonas sp.]|nr:response regulator [Parafilimonas sp.]
MQRENTNNFIIVDDNPIDITLCTAMIKKVVKDADIISFEFPQKAFAYIQNEMDNAAKDFTTFLFLDLNMPIWDGFEFLDNFLQLGETTREKFKIIVLSVCHDRREKQRALNYPCVLQYIEKPLTINMIHSLVNKQQETGL